VDISLILPYCYYFLMYDALTEQMPTDLDSFPKTTTIS
jgi:hypothetical protein